MNILKNAVGIPVLKGGEDVNPTVFARAQRLDEPEFHTHRRALVCPGLAVGRLDGRRHPCVVILPSRTDPVGTIELDSPARHQGQPGGHVPEHVNLVRRGAWLDSENRQSGQRAQRDVAGESTTSPAWPAFPGTWGEPMDDAHPYGMDATTQRIGYRTDAHVHAALLG